MSIEPSSSEQAAYYQRVVDMHHHEDTLLNSRLQTFVVSTSFLAAAYAQFKNWEFHSFALRILVCIFGLSVACVFRNLLGRTSKAIEWYIEEARSLESLIFSPNHQPYNKRRLEKVKSPKWAVSKVLGHWIPNGVILFWIAVFSTNFMHVSTLLEGVSLLLLFSLIILWILGMHVTY